MVNVFIELGGYPVTRLWQVKRLILVISMLKWLSDFGRAVWLHGHSEVVIGFLGENGVDLHQLLDIVVAVCFQTTHVIRNQIVLVHLQRACATWHIGLWLWEFREGWRCRHSFFLVEIDTCDHLHWGFSLVVVPVDWVDGGVRRHWVQRVVVVLEVVVFEILDSLDKVF